MICFNLITLLAFSISCLLTFLNRLLAKVALITGGATGIGESIVRLFHKHGAKVCIVDLQDDLGDKLCKSLAVDSACFIHGDVTVEDDISKAVDFTVKRFGTLDILINNAGLSRAPVSGHP